MSLLLVKPSKELEIHIRDYRQEYLNYGEKYINGSCGLIHYENIDEWIDMVHSIEKDTLTRENVHASTFFSIRESDTKIIGSIQLRHTLSEELEKEGGHIGYGIRPSERRKGYATEQLRLVLDFARQMNIPKVMISCDKSNVGSAKVILNNKGVLEKESMVNNEIIQIYWLELFE